MQASLLALQLLFDLTEQSARVAALPLQRFPGREPNPNASLSLGPHSIPPSPGSETPNKPAQNGKVGGGNYFFLPFRFFFIIIVIITTMLALTLRMSLTYLG